MKICSSGCKKIFHQLCATLFFTSVFGYMGLAQVPKLVLQTSHSDEINHVEYSSDSRYLLTVDKGNIAKVWDVISYKCITTLSSKDTAQSNYHSGRQLNIRIEPGMYAHFINSSKDVMYGNFGKNYFYIWRNQTGIKKIVLPDSNRIISAVSLLNSGGYHRFICNSFASSFLTIYDEEKDSTSAFKVSDKPVFSLVGSPDGKYIVTQLLDSTVTIWETLRLSKIAEYKSPVGLGATVFSSDEQYTLCGNIGNLCVYDILQKKKVFCSEHSDYASISGDSRYLLRLIGDSIQYHDLQSHRIEKKVIPGFSREGWKTIRISPDTKYLFASDNFRSAIYNIETKPFREGGWRPYKIDMQNISLSNDGSQIAASFGNLTTVFKTRTWTPLFSLNGLEIPQNINWSFTNYLLKVVDNSNRIIAQDLKHNSSQYFVSEKDIAGIRKLLGKGDVKCEMISYPGSENDIYLFDRKYLCIADADSGYIKAVVSFWAAINYLRISPDGKMVSCELQEAYGALNATCFLNIQRIADEYEWVKIHNGYIEARSITGAAKFFEFGIENYIFNNLSNGQYDARNPLLEPPAFFRCINRISTKTSFSQDRKLLLIPDESGNAIWVYNAAKSLVEPGTVIKAYGVLNSLCVSHTDSFIVFSVSQSMPVVWSINENKPVVYLEAPQIKSSFLHEEIKDLIVSFNDRYVVGTFYERNYTKVVIVWNVNSGKVLHIITGCSNDYDYILHPKENTLLYVLSDGTTNTIDLETGIKRVLFNRSGELFDRIVYHPSKGYIITFQENVSTTFWNATGLQKKLSIEGTDFQYVNDTEIISYDGNVFNVYNLEKGRLLYKLMVADSGVTMVSTPENYYAVSKDLLKYAYYVKGLRVISLPQLDTRYNRPDKALEALGSTDTALISSYRKAYEKRIRKSGIDTLAFRSGFDTPEADFVNRETINEQSQSQLALHIIGTDSTYPLDYFNVWINDNPLYGAKGISLKSSNKYRFDTTITVLLSDGRNQIETSVTSRNGTESYRMPLYVNYIPQKPDSGKLHFIGIGINHFANSQNNLSWSVKDVRDLANNFKIRYGHSCTIDTLFDKAATAARVASLKKRLLQTGVNDKVIIAYSGHGLLSKDYNYYLSTYNINFSKPEDGGLPYEVLENLLDSIPARKKLILIDACHSGEVDKEEMQQYQIVQQQLDSTKKGVHLLANKDSKRLGMKNSFELMQELFVSVGRSTGATIISAATGTQFALERNNLQNGVFTYSILEYMKAHSHTSISELKKWVNRRVPELTRGAQVPTARSETNNMDWEIW